MSKTYKIGEAAALLNLKTYVLRFWETEFPEIVPLRTEKGQRLYAEEHIALLERIRYLLHDRGLTIGGARKALEEEQARGVAYSFGVPGAITRDATRPTKQPAELEQFDLDEDEDEETFSPAPYIDYPLDTGHHAASRPLVRRKGQCNLPGIEEPAAIYDDAPPEPEDSDRASSDIQGMLPLFSMVRANPAASKTAPAGTNFIRATAPDSGKNTEKSSGQSAEHAVGQPGNQPGNQPGSQLVGHAATSAAVQSFSGQFAPAAPQAEKAAPAPLFQGISPKVLHDVIHELQAVAALLQGSATAPQHTGTSSAFSPLAGPKVPPLAGPQAGPAAAHGSDSGRSFSQAPDETANTARPDTPAPFSEPR